MNYNEEKNVELEGETRNHDSKERNKQNYWDFLNEKIQDRFRECDRILDRSMIIANAMIAMEKQSKKSNS